MSKLLKAISILKQYTTNILIRYNTAVEKKPFQPNLLSMAAQEKLENKAQQKVNYDLQYTNRYLILTTSCI